MNLKTDVASRTKNADPTRVGRRPQALRLSVALALTVTAIASGQSYRVLKSFNGNDGSFPSGRLVLSGSTLYGTTRWGGSLNCGLVFKVNTDGSGFMVLKDFTRIEGYEPNPGLIIDGGTLYGTTSAGGSHDYGVVFKLSIDGSGFQVLRNFAGGGPTDGQYPEAGVVLAGSTLYGTATQGGITGQGVIFKLNANGSSFAILKSFTGTDGWSPRARLLLSGSTLFGTTYSGGTWDFGVVFSLSTSGTGYKVLKSFSGADGQWPEADLVLTDGRLYGATSWGGSSSCGVVFKISTNGSGYTVLKNLGGSDGAGWPTDLAPIGSILYGTAYGGGASNLGVVFKLNTDGSGYEVTKNFSGNDGASPFGGLILAGDTLYGTTSQGGLSNNGVVFALRPAPPAINQPPASRTAELESTVGFSVRAHGDPPLTYRWFFAETNLVSASTNSVLQRTNVQFPETGAYSVVVSNWTGAVTSPPAMLSVIAPVPRRTVPALTLRGQLESFLNLDSRATLDSSANWETFDTVSVTNVSQWYFDLTAPLTPQRFYRVWQTNVLSPPYVPDLHLVPAITLTGAIGSSVRLDYINQFGPIDAWVTLDTVTLTSSTQLYFDTSVIGQAPRLYRIVPLP